ncbi:MAG: Jag N-terminal domain-containing protein [Actinomycetota bacterium]|nr:Jag N-terminal domain-containing protein [Actinomycetota bacterium]
MEWVEVTARTVEEAKEAALDQLGVDEVDAEFEVVEAPKGGLFGRLRSEARVRARVSPTTPRPKLERRGRRQGARDRGGDSSGGASAAGGPRRDARADADASGGSHPSRPKPRRAPARPSAAGSNSTKQNGGNDVTTDGPKVDEGELAESFLRGLLDATGADFTLARRQVDDETTELDVKGNDLGLFIGHRGQTLSAIQELTRTVVQRHGPGPHQRVLVDVADYRKARREALERFTRDVAEQVLASGKERVLEPMRPADRKVVHDTINGIDGVSTASEGEEPRRRVVITPDSAN